jgi:hypothetical protein
MRPTHVIVAAVLVLAPSICLAQAAAVCNVSKDPEFGFGVEKAVPIGGGAATIAARQKRYFDALRGPEGQPLEIGERRIARTTEGIVDIYPVTYEGGETIRLYLNSYRFGTPQVPQGFTCTTPLSRALGAPPFNLLTAAEEIGALGVAQGADREFPPIPLGDGDATRAAMFDYFRLLALQSRAAAAAGRPVGPAVPRPAVVIVASPLVCNGTLVPATEIDVLAGPQEQPLQQRSPGLLSSPQIAEALPGAAIEPGVAGAMFFVPYLAPNQVVRIRYGSPPDSCPDGMASEHRLPIRIDQARPLVMTRPELPADNTEADPAVFVQAVIDMDGAFQRPLYVAGPESLREAALAAIGNWRATPGQLNGEPVVQPVILLVEFTR